MGDLFFEGTPTIVVFPLASLYPPKPGCSTQKTECHIHILPAPPLSPAFTLHRLRVGPVFDLQLAVQDQADEPGLLAEHRGFGHELPHAMRLSLLIPRTRMRAVAKPTCCALQRARARGGFSNLRVDLRLVALPNVATFFFPAPEARCTCGVASSAPLRPHLALLGVSSPGGRWETDCSFVGRV